jgi:SET domain-containing protein
MLYPAIFGNDPLFPHYRDFQIVDKDEFVGKGVISFRAFEKGTVIAKITGERISAIRQHTLQIDSETHLFDTWFSGYFLHSCDPNISLNMKDMTVTALKNIAPNSFLYMDYAETEDHLFRQFPCNCRAQNCRGWISGRKELPASQLHALSATIGTGGHY